MINRELSWLSFNERVLQEALDPSVPLMQRLRFLGIFSNNQDEFIKVRVGNLLRLFQLKEKNTRKLTGNHNPKELLDLVNLRLGEVRKIFTSTYNTVLSEMENHGIYVVKETELNESQRVFCREYFSTVISPRLVPLILKKSTTIPFLRDNNVYHAVKMVTGKNANVKYSIIQIPVSSACPRFIVLPSEKERKDIIFQDDIIRLCLDEIFFMFNYDTVSAHTFKLIRDAQLTLDDDISKSLIEKMELGLDNRLHNRTIRLNYDENMPEDLLNLIASKLQIKRADALDPGGRYHLMRDLMKFPRICPELENSNPPPLFHAAVQPFSSILKVIAKQDILLNYPYHTFNHFIDFLREAAIDPKCDSIFITLYRTAERSKVINALINAAKNGKKVVVLLELMARFDEEQNLENSELLQKSGVKVIHGIKGLKVHSKLVLVERRQGSSMKGYAYVGTGNFNESTAKIYSDFGLFTSDEKIVNDVRMVFDYLLNTHKRFNCRNLLVSPYYMRSRFENLIYREIKNAQKGKEAYIYAKFNSLTDEKMIRLLYKAGREGVKIKLIIRGACCLCPQVKGLSENIQVISIVDKYLEHARLTVFCNDGEELFFISSADWMTRNLDRRVEVAAPILDKKIRQTLKSFFQIQWADNIKARTLSASGDNEYVEREDNEICRSQVALYGYYENENN